MEWWRRVVIAAGILAVATVFEVAEGAAGAEHRNAYAAMMYMGTPRDYEFYVAMRVMMRSLRKLNVDADLVIIASVDVPPHWVRALKEEDGLRVEIVDNMNNPYKTQYSFDDRFKLTMNKLYAWRLVNYDSVVMLDSDNLFLQKTDELFQCGQFCAAFINPCIFHTGLFVLQPSMEVFKDMVHELEIGRPNPDGADQGFLSSYFSDLLDMPMFHPPSNGTKLDGRYRLPLGYQMDASYYSAVECTLRTKQCDHIPGARWLKPWYWWSWPVLPLGFSWHEQRRRTLGYGAEVPLVLIQSVLYLGIIAITRLSRPNMSKLCYRRPDKTLSVYHVGLKFTALFCVLSAYVVPFLIPRTVHPLVGWSLYLLGSSALSCIAINAFLLSVIAVLTPCIGIFGALLALAFPWYSDGVFRALSIFAYAVCFTPFLWVSFMKVLLSLPLSLEREAFLPRSSESPSPLGFNKLY